MTSLIRRRLLLIVFLAGAMLVLLACDLSSVTGALPGPSKPSNPSSAYNHVYVIVMENQDFSSIIGNSKAPYLNSLIDDFGLASGYTAVAHPSQPNYLALFSGSTQGIKDDQVHDFAGQNIVDQLEARGKTWRVYEQNYPMNCYAGATSDGGADGKGTYARKHNPAISFTDIRNSPARCANITDMSHFDPAAANFEFIVPNLCNDMHDCAIADGDSFLSTFVPKIINSDTWKKDGLLFIVWDEGTEESGGNNQVPLLVISNGMVKGLQSPIPHDHYALLRTIQDIFGLGCLNQTCSANAITEFFK